MEATGKNKNSHKFLLLQTRLFADDCTIFRDVAGREDCEALQSDLHHLYQWAHKWQLHLNLSKCKALCISNKRMPPTYTYHLNGVSLEWVVSFTYLGVKITHKLCWSEHVTSAAAKANRILSLLRRSMYGCSEEAKKRAYVALVRPHLEYCSPVWNPHLKTVINLSRYKNGPHTGLAVGGITTHTHGHVLMRRHASTLNWKHWKVGEWCCQCVKFIKLFISCSSFNLYFKFNTNCTRSHQLSILCTASRVKCFRYSFFVNAPYFWNSFLFDVLNSESYSCFKKQLYTCF